MKRYKFEEICTADCPIKNTVIEHQKTTIHFEKIYIIENKKWLNNIVFVIKNWSTFEAKVFIYSEKDMTPVEKVLLGDDIEHFDLVQDILIKDNKLVLIGWGTHWMEYHFSDYDYEIFQEN